MSDLVHNEVHQVVAENPHLVGAFNWVAFAEAVKLAIPVIMQIIALLRTQPPVPTPVPPPTPTPAPVHTPTGSF